MLFGETARKVCICRWEAASQGGGSGARVLGCSGASCLRHGEQRQRPGRAGRGQEASRAGRDGSWGLKGREKDLSFHPGGTRKWLLSCGRRRPEDSWAGRWGGTVLGRPLGRGRGGTGGTGKSWGSRWRKEPRVLAGVAEAEWSVPQAPEGRPLGPAPGWT